MGAAGLDGARTAFNAEAAENPERRDQAGLCALLGIPAPSAPFRFLAALTSACLLAGCLVQRPRRRVSKVMELPEDVRIEFRLAEDEPADGLDARELPGAADGAKVFLRPEAVLSEADCPGFQVVVDRAGPQVVFHFTDEGARTLAEVTREARRAEARLAVLLDGELVVAPRVMEPVTGGRAQLAGGDMRALIETLTGVPTGQ
jgi:hypothetical protein